MDGRTDGAACARTPAPLCMAFDRAVVVRASRRHTHATGRNEDDDGRGRDVCATVLKTLKLCLDACTHAASCCKPHVQSSIVRDATEIHWPTRQPRSSASPCNLLHSKAATGNGDDETARSPGGPRKLGNSYLCSGSRRPEVRPDRGGVERGHGDDMTADVMSQPVVVKCSHG